jgi:sugar lactone lactonase YvrE
MTITRATPIEVFDETACELGESPSWDPRTGEVAWVDILAGRLYRRPLGGDRRTLDTPVPVGAAIACRAEGFLLNLEDGPALLAENGTVTRLGTFVEADSGRAPAMRVRGNDAKCDPRGRAFIGTMEYTETIAAGALYRLDPTAVVPVPVLPGALVSNGLGWSPDVTKMYYADSPTGRVDVFDYDVDSGALSNRRPLIEVETSSGLPDGLSIDIDGCIWLALWNGAGVRRYTPSGELDRIVELPCPKTTSCAFVGAALDQLVVTSAWHGIPADERRTSGRTFIFDPGVTGVPVSGFGR